jgi:putative ABC transport system permease protein
VKSALVFLVRLFPASFREQFGAEMIDQVRHDYDVARARGRPTILWFTLSTAVDLLHASVAERFSPTWPSVAPAPSESQTMRSILAEWGMDLRLALRTLGRSRAFAVVTIGTLGLAIGVNAGMFSVVNAVLLHPLPYANTNRLLYIAATAPGSDMPPRFGVGNEFYLQYRERSQLLEDVATFNSFTNTLRTPDRVERVRMSWPTYTLFSTLGAKPILGRLPVAADEERAVVISHALWSNWFGRDSTVIGRSYDVGGEQRQVIGVMGPEFTFPYDGTMLWISGDIRPTGIVPGRFGNELVARMKPGTTPEAVARELTALSKQLPERFGGSASYARLIGQHRALVRPLQEQMVGSVSRPLWVLLGAVGIVLIIACANVTNLFMVRTESRQRELAVRRAVGAARAQLVRLQMAEALVVAAIAGVLAMTLAWAGLPAFLRAAPTNMPRISEVHLDAQVLLFTLAAALVSALACGLIPAIRGSAPDLTRLREAGGRSTRRRHWGRNGLVVGQTALALILLIGSGLLIRSFAKLSRVDPGYTTKDIFTFQIAPEGPTLRDGPSFAQFDMDFMERLRALPGVQLVGLVENIPLNEGTAVVPFRTEDMSNEPDAGKRVSYTYTAGDYFKAMNIDLVAGESFASRDLAATLGKVVVSRSAADALWPGKDPLGRRLQRVGRDSSNWFTVIGVVEDVMQYGFRDTAQALVYFPLTGPTPMSWGVSSPAYVVKTPRAETIVSDVRALVREVAPSAPMYRIYTMAQLARDSMVQLSFTMLTLVIVSTLALILGAVGLYGVLSYVVAERTREIGVRMALGAEAGQVRRMVVVQGATVVALGVVIGVVVALVSTRALGSLLFGVAAVDVATFVGMSASMIAVGLLASYVPARRASSVDPMESLRSD